MVTTRSLETQRWPNQPVTPRHVRVIQRHRIFDPPKPAALPARTVPLRIESIASWNIMRMSNRTPLTRVTDDVHSRSEEHGNRLNSSISKEIFLGRRTPTAPSQASTGRSLSTTYHFLYRRKRQTTHANYFLGENGPSGTIGNESSGPAMN